MKFDRMKGMIILFICLQFSYSHADQSLVVLQDGSTDFHPANSVELLTTRSKISSTLQCYTQCHLNIQCRTFVYKSETQECFLYEGSINTGSVITTTSGETPSIVGGIIYTPELFKSYGLACDQCISSRYLTCVNNMCQCLPNTFWDGTMCLNQVYYGQTCAINQASCRQADLSLTCLSDCLICVGPSTACVAPSNSSSPIAFWSFDGNLSDSPAIAVGNISFVSGHVGQAVQLSGASYISSTFHNISFRSFSIEMWIYPTTILQRMGLFGQFESSGWETHFSILLTDNKLYVTFGWDDSAGSTTLQVNQWYHVAFVYDCNNQFSQLFLNGIEETICHPVGTGAGPYRGQCGATEIGNDYANVSFIGLIDQVSLWDRVRTAGEILADAMTVG